MLTCLGFVSIGLPDGLLGVAWPSMRSSFGLPIDALGSLLVMYTTGYLISSFGCGRVLAHVSIGSLLASSCFATGLSLIGYAMSGRWSVVLLLATFGGLGAGAIDAGLNTYAATHFSSGMVNWLHACYGIGALTGPLLMTSVLSQGRPWHTGYALVGCWQLMIAAGFGLTRRQWSNDRNTSLTTSEPDRSTRGFSTLRLRTVWFSIVFFFVYTGIEASAGAWAYSLFAEGRGMSMRMAGTSVSAYWASLTVGRIISAVISSRIAGRLLLRFCILGQSIGALLIWSDMSELVDTLSLSLIGLSSGPIFPSLIAATPDRIGRGYVSHAIGFQIAAAVLGQSLVPAVIGFLARRYGLEIIAPSLVLAVIVLFSIHEALIATLQHRMHGTQ